MTDHREQLRALSPRELAQIDQTTAEAIDTVRRLADQAAVDGPACCGGSVCVGENVGYKLLPHTYSQLQSLAFMSVAVRLLGDERARRNLKEAA